MSVIESNRSVPLGAVAAFRVVSFIERALDVLQARRSAHATAAELSALSDSQLEDIGLTRKQVHEARQIRDAERAEPG